MPAQPPDLSHLRGTEIEKVAKALSAGPIETILANTDKITALKPDELQRVVDLAAAARANCGGFGCG